MKVWTSNYHLYPKDSLNQAHTRNQFRKGTLIKVQFDGGEVGYADLCPFEQMGDEPLETQLNQFIAKQPTPLFQRAISLAQEDANARATKKSLLKGEDIKNHYLITNIGRFNLHKVEGLLAEGFDTFKVKLGSDLFVETEMVKELAYKIKDKAKLRLDFNCRFTEKKFRAWLERNLDEIKDVLEFIEDPCDYEPEVWEQFQADFNISLALDLAGDPLKHEARGANVVVIKPAIQDPFKIVEQLKDEQHRFVITHYMDYPVGQMAALAVTEKLIESGEKRLATSGLLAKDLYEPSDFSNAVQYEGAAIIPPSGTGVGFDDLLDEIQWTELS